MNVTQSELRMSRISTRHRAWPVCFLIIFLSAMLAAMPATAAPDCSIPALADLVECRELVLSYDATFDLAAFEARFGITFLVDVPELSMMSVLAADEADRDAIKTELELTTPLDFPGLLDIDYNHKLLLPECRQLGIALVEIGHILDDLQAQPAMAAIRAPEAWVLADGSPVIVAVADTGVDASHPALVGRLLPGLDLVDGDLDPDDSRNGVDDDGDGVTDPGYGHGTGIASLIATVAPGAWILPIRIADDECRTNAMQISAAITAAASGGASVFNLSFGMLEHNPWVQDAIAYARDRDMLIVVSVGNDGASPGQYPSRDRETLSVAATDLTGLKATFSSHDSSVNLAAPGVDLLAAYPGDQYARWNGTSFATALVSGVAALALTDQDCAGSRGLLRQLEDHAVNLDGIPGNKDFDLGAGMVDAAASINPGEALRVVDQLWLTKYTRDLVWFEWLPETMNASLITRVNSVTTVAEIARASDNSNLCPSCPAPSLTTRCDAFELEGVCLEPTPGLLIDPEPLLFLRALSVCGDTEGPLE
jgi:hypothetical protein